MLAGCAVLRRVDDLISHPDFVVVQGITGFTLYVVVVILLASVGVHADAAHGQDDPPRHRLGALSLAQQTPITTASDERHDGPLEWRFVHYSLLSGELRRMSVTQ